MSKRGCAFTADGSFACGSGMPAFLSDAPYRPPGPATAFSCGGAPPADPQPTKARSGAPPATLGGQSGSVPAAYGPGTGIMPFMPLDEFDAHIAHVARGG